MQTLKLYMLLLGCRPAGRHTEQHDIFFSIGSSLSGLVPAINRFWPGAKSNIHIDAWREVTGVDGYKISIEPRGSSLETINKERNLFFITLGGYKEKEFEEYHYKVLTIAKTPDEAKASARQTAFYKHAGFKGAPSHIDDKFGVDADDVYKVSDILPAAIREKYCLQIRHDTNQLQDEMHIAYLPLYKIPKAKLI
jgi:hypothetical protein